MNTADTEQGMSDTTNGNLEVFLVRIEGKLDRMGDRMAHYERDIDGIRSRLHDLNNVVTPLVMLDMPARIRTTDQWRADHDARLKTLEGYGLTDHDNRLTVLENIEQQRRGAAALAKILWAIGGAVGVSGVGAVVALLKGVI